MKKVLIAAILTLVAPAMAQTPNTGVSAKTINSVWNKIDQAFAKAGKVKPLPSVSLKTDKGARTVVIHQLYVTYKHYKPTFRCSPRPFRVIPEYIELNKDSTTKAELTEMVKWGFVSPAGPLVTGSETLSPEEFGDGLAYFYLQMKRLSYQPDPKWTAAISPS